MKEIEIVKNICSEIEKIGGKAYIVGGYVRDLIFQKPNKDIDVEVYGISYELLSNLVQKYDKKANLVGNFAVIKMSKYDIEFCVAREERKIGKGYSGFSIIPNPDLSIKECAMRRDLTINAIYLDILRNELIDPFNGQDDINNKILRATSDRFVEDPLRVYRVAQFSSRFEFEIDEKTALLCSSIKDTLCELPKERIFTEFRKILFKSSKPSIAFNNFYKLGILDNHPSLKKIYKTDKWESLLNKLDSLEYRKFIDISNDVVSKEEMFIFALIEFYAPNFIKEISLETDIQRYGEILNYYVKNTLSGLSIGNITDSFVKQLSIINRNNFHVFIKDFELYNTITSLIDKKVIDKIVNISKKYDCYEKKYECIIQGKDLIELGLKPSRLFGEIIEEILQLQIKRDIDKDSALQYIKEKYIE